METIEQVLDMLGTVRKLEKRLLTEADPRERAEIAETLDLLAPSFDKLVERLGQELKAS
jgi:hypothetical protein